MPWAARLPRLAALAALAVLVMLPPLAGGAEGSGRVLLVPYQYGSLGEALKAASPGDVIYLAPGRYRLSGTLTVDKPVYIIGAGQGETILSTENYRETVLQVEGVRAVIARLGLEAVNGKLRVEAVKGATLYLVDAAVNGDVGLGAYSLSSLVAAGLRGSTRASPFIDAGGAIEVVLENASLTVKGSLIDAANTQRVVLSGVEAYIASGWGPGAKLATIEQVTVTGSILVSATELRIENTGRLFIDSSYLSPNGGSRILVLKSVDNATITRSVVAGRITVEHEASVTSFGTVYVATDAVFEVSGVLHVAGGRNVFIASRFCTTRFSASIKGVLDEAPSMASYYSFASPRLPDEKHGPAQSLPGGDGIGDEPLELCPGQEVRSLYPAKQPPAGLPGVICGSLPGSSRPAGWTVITLDGVAYAAPPLTRSFSRASVVLQLTGHTGSAEATISSPGGGWRLRIVIEDGAARLEAYTAGQLVAVNTSSFQELPGLHRVAVEVDAAAGAARLLYDATPLAVLAGIPAPTGGPLCISYRGFEKLEEIRVEGGRWLPSSPAGTPKLPSVKIETPSVNYTITVPVIALSVTGKTAAVTATTTKTVTLTTTLIVAKTRTLKKTVWETKTVTVTRPGKTVTEVKYLNKTITEFSTLTYVGLASRKEAKSALVVALLGLVAALVVARLAR